jgi:hypothetical protein
VLALADPPTAAGAARVSLGILAVAGFAFLVGKAIHRTGGAIALLPNWFLLCAWVFAAALAASGALSGDLIAPALLGGLVLIALLIGLTVMVRRGEESF